MELCCLRADSSSRQPYKQLLGAGQCLALARVAGFEPSHSHCNLWTRQCSEFHFLSPRAVSSLFCPTSTRPAKCGGPPSRAGQEHLSYPSKLFLVVFSPPQSWSLSWQVRKDPSNIRALGTGCNCSWSSHLLCSKHWAALGKEQPKNLPFSLPLSSNRR